MTKVRLIKAGDFYIVLIKIKEKMDGWKINNIFMCINIILHLHIMTQIKILNGFKFIDIIKSKLMDGGFALLYKDKNQKKDGLKIIVLFMQEEMTPVWNDKIIHKTKNVS